MTGSSLRRIFNYLDRRTGDHLRATDEVLGSSTLTGREYEEIADQLKDSTSPYKRLLAYVADRRADSLLEMDEDLGGDAYGLSFSDD